ncbi:hypothetical protein ACFL0X_02880 [Nanoarchaeota archaeon]
MSYCKTRNRLIESNRPSDFHKKDDCYCQEEGKNCIIRNAYDQRRGSSDKRINLIKPLSPVAQCVQGGIQPGAGEF